MTTEHVAELDEKSGIELDEKSVSKNHHHKSDTSEHSTNHKHKENDSHPNGSHPKKSHSEDDDYEESRSLKNIFSSLSWEEYALIAVTFIVFVIYFIHVSSYTQIPSPIFGGDHYRDRTFVKNIVAGNPFWSDAYYANEINYYPYLIPMMEAYFIKLTGADVDKTFLYFPLLTLWISVVIWYCLGLRLFKSKKWALLTAIAFLFITNSLTPKTGVVADYIFIPAFLLFWLIYEQDNNFKDAIIAGIFLGLVSLTYGGIFLAAVALIAGYVVFFFIVDVIKTKNLFKTVWDYIKKYYVIFLLAFLICMIYFLPLIIKYHFHQVNLVTVWGDASIDTLGPLWVLDQVRYLFFNTYSIPFFILTIICLIGFVVMLLAKKTKESTFLIMIFFVNLITIMQHFVMRPLFNITFISNKLVYFTYLIPLYLVFGVKFIYQYFKPDMVKKIFYAAIILVCAISFFIQYNSFANSQWEKMAVGDNAYIRSLYSLGDYMEKNMAKDETALSNDETGFMLAAVSGRKVMLTRRTHASYFIDIDQRIADADVAMYGTDINLSKQILAKYNVKYLYLDSNFFQYPMRVRTDLRDYLTTNKINFTQVYDRYDIAVPPDKAYMMDLLLIPPQSLNTEFLNLWTKVYSVQVNGQVVGELYKLR